MTQANTTHPTEDDVKKVTELNVSREASFRGEDCVKLSLQLEDGSVFECALSRKYVRILMSKLQGTGAAAS